MDGDLDAAAARLLAAIVVVVLAVVFGLGVEARIDMAGLAALALVDRERR
jgi:hypothetical protein